MSAPTLPPGYAVTELDTQNVNGSSTAAPNTTGAYAAAETDTTALGSGNNTAGAAAPEFSSGNHTVVADTGSGFAVTEVDTSGVAGHAAGHDPLNSVDGPGAFVQNFNGGTEDTTQPGPPVPSTKSGFDSAASAQPTIYADNAYVTPKSYTQVVTSGEADTWDTNIGAGAAGQAATSYSANSGLYGAVKDSAVLPTGYDASGYFHSGYDANPALGDQYVANTSGTRNVTAPPTPAIVSVTADSLGQRLDVSYEVASDYTGEAPRQVNVYVYKVSGSGNTDSWPTATRLGPVGVAQVDAPSGLALTASATGGTIGTATYYYKVTAINGVGETVGSNEVTHAFASGTTNSSALTWTGVVGATGYKVYRGTVAGAENVLLATVTGTSYTDTGTAGTAATVPAANTTAQNGSVVVDRLEPEVTYKVAVSASNVNGESALSALSAGVKVTKTHGL